MPGVVGSTVEVATSAQIQTLPTASSVAAASLAKTVAAVTKAQAKAREEGSVTAQKLYNTPKLPPQINVSVSLAICAAGGGVVAAVVRMQAKSHGEDTATAQIYDQPKLPPQNDSHTQ
jgi:hypothetical protein